MSIIDNTRPRPRCGTAARPDRVEVLRMREMRTAGQTLAAIAADTGRSLNTVHLWTRRTKALPPF